MPTPVKPIGTGDGKIGAKATKAREKAEKAAMPKTGDPIPSHELTEGQRNIWDAIIEYFRGSDLLAPLDGMTLTPFVVSLDAVRQIDLMISKNPELLDSSLVAKRKVYMTEVWRGGQEFCLSPQARAKIGSLAAAKAKQAEADPLTEALK